MIDFLAYALPALMIGYYLGRKVGIYTEKREHEQYRQFITSFLKKISDWVTENHHNVFVVSDSWVDELFGEHFGIKKEKIERENNGKRNENMPRVQKH